MRSGIKFTDEEKNKLYRHAAGCGVTHNSWNNYVFLRGCEAGYQMSLDTVKSAHEIMRNDLTFYGVAYERVLPDGTIERLDPTTIRVIKL